jgi:uncharacterized protein YcbK (DUF882 family)
MGDISPNFSWVEFRCHDDVETPVPDDLRPNLHGLVYGVLEPIRAEVGHSIEVLSGYRTAAHNRAVLGAPDSRHLHADAADIHVPFMRTDDLWAMIRHLWQSNALPGLGGLGLYDTWCHVDARPHEPGVLAQWDLRTPTGG